MVTKSDYIEAKDASLDASVVILTYNGEQHIDEILASLTTQRFDGTYEILVIDSGSTDSTLDLIAKYPSVRLVQIPNSEFGHGKTRNLGAHLAGPYRRLPDARRNPGLGQVASRDHCAL